MSGRRKEKKLADVDPKKKGKPGVHPLKAFADKLRDGKDLDSRWAVLQESRVEYFRGKDFAAVISAKPELTAGILLPDALEEADKAGEAVEEIAAQMLLRGKLIVRCDRVMKAIRPNRKKLSKWPARLELHREQVFTEDDGFYAWTFERSRPFWQTLLSILVPIITVACCLFPVFPHWAKLGVLYSCLTFLGLIFGLLFVRWVVFGVVWIVAGRRIWFFPNILAEEASLAELLRFWPDTKDEEPPPKWTTRLAVAVITGVCMWLSVRHAPDEHTRAKYRKKVGNIIDEVLVWKPTMMLGNQSAKAADPPPTATAPPSGKSRRNTSEIPVEELFEEAARLGEDLAAEEEEERQRQESSGDEGTDDNPLGDEKGGLDTDGEQGEEAGPEESIQEEVKEGERAEL